MDQAGPTSALTTLSPILPERMRQLDNRLRVVRYTPGLSRPLLQLAFIHYARWIVLDKLPAATGTGGWRGLRWRYLLFESNYDGEQHDYLRTFADVVPARLAKLWGACFGFDARTRPAGPGDRGVLDGAGFQDYVKRTKLTVGPFFRAYPDATATDVRQALALHQSDGSNEYDEGPSDTRSLALGPSQRQLKIKERVRSVYDPWWRAVRGRYEVNPTTIVAPLTHDEKQLPPEVLDRLTGTNTHFARLVIIPRNLVDLGQPDPDRLETSYLLYTSDSWGTPYEHIAELRTKLGETADEIWGDCVGYPEDGHENEVLFNAWMRGHMLATRYYVAGYPPHSPSDIKEALIKRKRLAHEFGLRDGRQVKQEARR